MSKHRKPRNHRARLGYLLFSRALLGVWWLLVWGVRDKLTIEAVNYPGMLMRGGVPG